MPADRPLVLATAFRQVAAPALRKKLPAALALERALRGVLGRAREEHPEVVVPDPEFAAHLARKMDPEMDPLASIAALHAGDAYLA
ncbi:MAG TPA: hypothetical protein VIG99_06365, partial [Myxococcaceae bacterium]